MAEARWRDGLGERLAGLAALGFALACILCCGKGRPAWSEDGLLVAFDYLNGEERAAVAVYDVERGEVRTALADSEYTRLLVAQLGAAGDVVLVGTQGHDADQADVLRLDAEGGLRVVHRFEEQLSGLLPVMPAVVHGGALWFVAAKPSLEGRSKARRLDLATGALDQPFGEREVALHYGPAGEFYFELLSQERLAIGRAHLDEARLEPLAELTLDQLGVDPETEGWAGWLSVGTERLAFVAGVERVGEDDPGARPARVRVLLYDLAGEFVLDRRLQTATPRVWSPVLAPDDEHLWWIVEGEDALLLRRDSLHDGAVERRALPFDRPTLETGRDLYESAALSFSPTGGHIAVALRALGHSDMPDLLLFETGRGLEEPRAVRVPRR